MDCEDFSVQRFLFRLMISISCVYGVALSATGKPQPSDSVAIIGAGASGLAAAKALHDKGYTNVTLFEKEARVGGKVFSLPHDNYTFEIGAFWIGEYYPTVTRLAKEYNVEFVTESLKFEVYDENLETELFDTFILAKHSVFAVAKALWNYQRLKAKFRDDLEQNGFAGIDPELFENFETFAVKHGIEPLADSFRPFWIGCGYGYYETTPAIYVLKLMLPAMESSVRNAVLNAIPFVNRRVLKKVDGGFQSIFKAIANDLPYPIHLSEPVVAVTRPAAGSEDQRIVVETAKRTQAFDWVLNSVDPKASLNFLDADANEQTLFSQVERYNYYLQVFKGSNLDHIKGKLLLPDHYGEIEDIGHMTLILNRAERPTYYTAAQPAPWDMSAAEVLDMLRSDVADLGGTVDEVILQQQWNYFPYVSQESLQSGFYDKLEARQGVRGMFFIGGIMNFETVETVTAYSEHLIKKFF